VMKTALVIDLSISVIILDIVAALAVYYIPIAICPEVKYKRIIIAAEALNYCFINKFYYG